MQGKSIQSQGGKARAQKLTPEERSKIASDAAAKRWTLPEATHEGDLVLGNASLHCAVLKDGRRLITQSDFMRALGRARQAKGRAYYDSDVNLPAFITAKNLKPFIDKELYVTSSQVEFRTTKGARAFGYPADLLPKVCEVFLRARDAGALVPSQAHIAKQADILMRGLATVGIIALVDEATGHQFDRASTALAEILEKFISKELRAWATTFPLEFYRQIFRLQGWEFDPKSVKRPSVIGHWTNDIVYRRLAPGVLKELQQKNPVIEGRRKQKHFQWLTGEIGHPKLLAHLEGVKILMRESNSWDELMTKLDRHYPIIETTDLGFDIEVSSRK